jgi:peptidoglycan/xylan/chitin deacetylase (PgdA/CDA1 family)
MKAAVRNLAIHGLAATRRVGRRAAGDRVIAFHDVPDGSRFSAALDWLATRYDVVPLADVVRGRPSGRPRVALTFDDGYASWHSDAVPALKRRAMPATFFVCSGYVGLTGEAADRFRSERLRMRRDLSPLTVDQLRDLARNPLFVIGAHTVNHTDLGGNPSEELLDAEIGADRRQLEAWTDAHVCYFAYAFGQRRHVSDAAVAYLGRQGFEAAFTIRPGPVGGDLLRVPRHSLDLSDPPSLWSALLEGGYDAPYRIKEAIEVATRRVRAGL